MKQKYLILSLVMILVAVAFFIMSSSMISKKISKASELDKNSAKVMNQQLSQFALIIDNSLTKQKSFSPTEVNTFVKNLADLADQNQIAVLAIYPKEVQSGLNLVEQQYIMELNTSYVQLGQFLSNLEALDNIVKINTLDVMPLTEADTGKSTKAKTSTGPRIARYKVAIELSVFKVQKEG
jgi:Tfp pilus assembly protein PilO